MHLPPVVGLWLTFALIFFLFWRESREKRGVSRALWIPVIWLLITGSRFPTQWMNLGQNMILAAGDEGSPIDALTFLGLILGGVFVLNQRGVSLSQFARQNRWLTVFLVYSLIAIFWSDFPFIAAKRWIKIMGHPIMALVILTEANPQEAVRTLLKRIGYVLVPLSICFIKYLPEYGRGFDQWTGEGFNCGVALNKNGLGCLSMILGIFFFWNLLQAFRIKERRYRRAEILLSVSFLGMTYWLLQESSSATSLLTMIVGMVLIWVSGLPFIDRRHIGAYVIGTAILLVTLEPIFGIYATVVKSVGRNLTLTDRTDVWHYAIMLQSNPILGAGFESFWLGKRLDTMWQQFWWRPLQAHNGYIETYLNLGFVGLIVLAGQLLGTFQKASRDLMRRFELGRLRLGFLIAIIIYNYTEAAFVNVSFVWTMFFIIAIDYQAPRRLVVRRRSDESSRKMNETVFSAGV